MSANELVARLDETHGNSWQIWRAAMGQWCVQIPRADGQRQTVDAPDLDAALLAAIEWRDLPTIPRRPEPIYELRPVKDGSKWRLTQNGSDGGGNIATKTRALELVASRKARAEKNCADWDEKYGAVASGVEGVDFRYGRFL